MFLKIFSQEYIYWLAKFYDQMIHDSKDMFKSCKLMFIMTSQTTKKIVYLKNGILLSNEIKKVFSITSKLDQGSCIVCITLTVFQELES